MAVDRGSHARHDRFAIADSIGGGLAPATLDTCPACGVLRADLLSLQRAIRESWLPSRPRDLGLSVAIALRLRRRSWRDRLALIGSSRDAITRPIAVGFTAIGLAGLLVTSIPAGASFGSAAASAEAGPGTIAAAPGDAGAPGPVTPAAGRAADPESTGVLMLPSLLCLGLGASTFMVRRLARPRSQVR